MARPTRMGLGYFPLDTDFLNDRKIRRLSQKFKNQGVMTYIATLCEIYGSNEYYIPFSAEMCFDIGFSVQLEQKEVEEILLYCVEIHLFDRERLEQDGILTSYGIQVRFREIYRIGRRKMPSLRYEVLSTAGDETEKEMEDDLSSFPNCAEAPFNCAETPGNCTETPIKCAETADFAAKTPTKEKKKKKENKKQNLSTVKNEKSYEYPTLDTAGETARRAELLRMALEATQGR